MIVGREGGREGGSGTFRFLVGESMRMGETIDGKRNQGQWEQGAREHLRSKY